MDAQLLLDCKTVVTVGKGLIGQVYSCMPPPCSPAQDVDESPYGSVGAPRGCQQLDGKGWERVLLEEVLQGWIAKAHAGFLCA